MEIRRIEAIPDEHKPVFLQTQSASRAIRGEPKPNALLQDLNTRHVVPVVRELLTLPSKT